MGIMLISFIVTIFVYIDFVEIGWRSLIPVGVFVGLEFVRLNFRLARNQIEKSGGREIALVTLPGFRKHKPSARNNALTATESGDYSSAEFILRNECPTLAEAWLECAHAALERGDTKQAMDWAKAALDAPVNEKTEPLAYERANELYCRLCAERGEKRDEVYRLLGEQLSGDLYGKRYDEKMKALGPESPDSVRLRWAYCAMCYGELDTAHSHWEAVRSKKWIAEDDLRYAAELSRRLAGSP